MADSKKYDGSQWEHSLRKLTTATEAVENPLYSDGTAITSYTIKGNTVQNGTPTPSNPVEVNGVGVRTENLLDKSTFVVGKWISDRGVISDNVDGALTTQKINVQVNETYTIKNYATGGISINGVAIGIYDSNNNFSRRVFSTNSETSFTIQSGESYFIVGIAKVGVTQSDINSAKLMLNTGSTAKPYEPYGYKIPILTNQQTTNIYLGSTQTVRPIKKIVFDGTEENWRITGTGRMAIPLSDLPQRLTTPYCTHFIGTTVENYGNMGDGECSISVVSGSVREFGCYDSTITTLADFKTWLATQYANGTPLTLWYVLATPETATVNEPLMKIGDFADTLSNATAIPTTEGANSITVDTTVQPSEFSATWTGWHDSSVKEWDGSQWNE